MEAVVCLCYHIHEIRVIVLGVGAVEDRLGSSPVMRSYSGSKETAAFRHVSKSVRGPWTSLFIDACAVSSQDAFVLLLLLHVGVANLCAALQPRSFLPGEHVVLEGDDLCVLSTETMASMTRLHDPCLQGFC